ncbi:MAG TPA: prepilin-type N-terminal cleavage/methylation domain-containing protein [Candidatus Hydrogenedens sp.]|nr:prepilin-type N-terminal cleavage/methylation domain-containing protein [Candidatus Hydrogenedens sp.]
MKKRIFGFTLIEVTISIALMGIISLLSFLALQSSVKSSSLSYAQNEIDSDLRNTFNELSELVKQAYSEVSTNVTPPTAPAGAEAIQVQNNGKGLRFFIPVPVNTPAFLQSSQPIVVQYENEDRSSEGVPPNAILDDGEDTNGDRALTRRLVMVQENNRRVIGSANCISNVEFQLLPDRSDKENTPTLLYIYLEGTKRMGPGEGPLIRAELSGIVKLEN